MFIGNLGRQDSDYDNELALNAEMVPPQPKQINLWVLGACIVAPGGLLVLGALAFRSYMKEKSCQSLIKPLLR